MAAWSAGGASLPHYSVAQHDATTPISAGQLRPGDLVFWGRPVTLDSMYYWVPPTFFGGV